MFEIEIDGTSLKNHFIRDGFFNDCNVLNIVDDYNIWGISNEAIGFYKQSFEAIGVTQINIYYQMKGVNQDRKSEMNVLARNYGINSNILRSYLVLAFDDFYPKASSLELLMAEKRNRIRKSLTQIITFLNTMEAIGVHVNFYCFNPIGLRPPFHGRYWFTDYKGYIVDASLNTFGKGMIFAQLMDQENFNTIKNTLFDNYIVNNKVNDGPLDLPYIEHISHLLGFR